MKQDIFYNKTINKKELKSIVHSTFQAYGIIKATNLAEDLKKAGFSFATQAGISISIEDLKVPPTKDILFSKNNTQINFAYFYEKRGNINEIERFQKVIDTWHTTSEILKNQLVDFFKTRDPLNPVYMMAFSGARGNLSQVRQLVGMRGLMSDPSGQIIDLPIKTNFREGLSITDYVISSYGARKGIVDTALRTADSGYLTRRLVDVAQHVIIRELDCQTKNGVRIFYKPGQNKEGSFLGRVLANSLREPFSNNILLERNTILTATKLLTINFPTNLILRSPLICESSRSICQKCYGWNLSQGQLVELADAVGVIAAQSIGEPGTQLTMRTFHTGGVFTGESSNQIRSTVDGQILFSENLKTSTSRTIYGEVIIKAQNVSEFFIFDTNQKILKRYAIKPEMLLFAHNKSFIKIGDVIAELPLANKRNTTQIKDIFATISGEIQFQNLQSDHKNTLIENGLIWIATGSIYDIFSYMLLRRQGVNVIKNNAIAQTKIVSPIGGIVKSSTNFRNYIVTPPAIFITEKLFRTLDNRLFFVGSGTRIFNVKQQSIGVVVLDLTKKFTLNTLYTTYYSRIHSLCNKEVRDLSVLLLCPFQPEVNLVKIKSLTLGSFLVDNNLANCRWDNMILYPGELLCDSISISQLSYCKIESVDLQTVRLFILPLKQGIIPKPSSLPESGISAGTVLSNTMVSSLTVIHKGILNPQEPFVETRFKVNYCTSNLCQTLKTKLQFIQVRGSNRMALFEIYKLPSNLKFINKQQIAVSYLMKSNQIVEPYSIIATLSITATNRMEIKKIKNRIHKPQRFLISSSENYKDYPSAFLYSKFTVVGDKLNTGDVIDYSGYLVRREDSRNFTVRLASPFFVSQGTRILVHHGALIKQGEPLCQLVYTRVISDDIVTGLPRIEQLLEGRLEKNPCELIERPGIIKSKNTDSIIIIEKKEIHNYALNLTTTSFLKKGELVSVAQPLDTRILNSHSVLNVYFQYYCSFYSLGNATKRSIISIQLLLLNLVQDVYRSQGIYIANKHVEIIVRQITSKVKILKSNSETTFTIGEFIEFEQVLYVNRSLYLTHKPMIEYQPVLLGITKVSLMTESFISAASFQETTRILTQAAVEGKVEWLRGLKENVILGRLIPAGTGFKAFNSTSMLSVCLE